MTFTHTRRVAVAAVSVLAFALVACGGSDTPTAASCAESWNADTNAAQQSTLVGTRSVDIILAGQFRVGTWPKSEQKVPVTKGFATRPSGEATVTKNSCVLVFPQTREGDMAFVETDGKWQFVRDNTGSTFPKAARDAVEGARVAKPDVLGKVKLGQGGES